MRELILMICGHYLADFGLQNDFTAKFKAPGSAPFWIHVMISHCAIQALPVFLVTQRWELALSEFCMHFLIDCFKCMGVIGFTADQTFHILCKLTWLLLLREGVFS
jgi:hypothetical protein